MCRLLLFSQKVRQLFKVKLYAQRSAYVFIHLKPGLFSFEAHVVTYVSGRRKKTKHNFVNYVNFFNALNNLN